MSEYVPQHRAALKRRRRPSRRVVVAAAVVGVAALVATLGFARQASTDSGPECGAEEGLRVVAAKEIAPVVEAVSRIARNQPENETDTACDAPTVVAADPAETADALRAERGNRPDVWIPDSSIWTTQLASHGTSVPSGNPSVASSPLVMAVAAGLVPAKPDGGLAVGDLLPAASQDRAPARWGLPDPKRSMAGVGALLNLKATLGNRPEAAGLLTAVLRGAQRDVSSTTGSTPLQTAAAGGLAVPATEQQVHAHNAGAGSERRLQAAYTDPQISTSADYPFVVFAATAAKRARAADLLTALQGDLGRRLVLAEGFRDAAGTPGPALSGTFGVDPGRPGTGRTLDGGAVDAAISALDTITRASRVLAVLDVSGSMATKVPSAGGATRLGLAVQATVSGLALYSDDTVAGLWTFSTNLTPTSDHEVLVPLVPLGRAADGTSGREQLTKGLGRVTVRQGGATGLYDTVLAAVRAVREGWDPDRVNSVVLVTDGANEDEHGVDLTTLLATLRAEQDPTRPVSVFAIAYGQDGDLAALQQIVGVTGGKAYPARDPLGIGTVLLDAIGNRACSPGC